MWRSGTGAARRDQASRRGLRDGKTRAISGSCLAAGREIGRKRRASWPAWKQPREFLHRFVERDSWNVQWGGDGRVGAATMNSALLQNLMAGAGSSSQFIGGLVVALLYVVIGLLSAIGSILIFRRIFQGRWEQ